MAARLEAIAAEYFLPVKPENRTREGDSVSSKGGKITHTSAEAAAGNSGQYPPTSSQESETDKKRGGVSEDDCGKSSTPLALLDSAHILPPLMLYFECLPTEWETTPAVSANEPAVPGLVRTSASGGVPTGCEVAWQRPRQFGSDPSDKSFCAKWYGKRRRQGTQKEMGAAVSCEDRYRGRQRVQSDNGLWRWCDDMDVFANFAQPPLSVVCASYEMLDEKHQRGLNAVTTLVEKCNDSFHREQWVTATSLSMQRPPFGFGSTEAGTSTNAGSMPACASTPTPTLTDYRSSIVNSLNSFLRSLSKRGDQVLVLHIIIRVATWRFCSRNERVTLLFNHIHACLPTVHPSTATLAMEAWAQLHAIGASSTVYLKIATEMLRLACTFISDVSVPAGQVSGFIMIHHIAQWPYLLYRTLLRDERDRLLLVIWKSLMSTHQPHVRELAAVALRSLFILDIVRGSYSCMRELLDRAALLVLSPGDHQKAPLSSPRTAPVTKGAAHKSQRATPLGTSLKQLEAPLLVGETACTPRAVVGTESVGTGQCCREGTSCTITLPSIPFFGCTIARQYCLNWNSSSGDGGATLVATESGSSGGDLLRPAAEEAVVVAKGELGNVEGRCFVPRLSPPANDEPFLCGYIKQVDPANKRFKNRLATIAPSHNADTNLHASTLVIGAFVSALRSCAAFLEIPPLVGAEDTQPGVATGLRGANGGETVSVSEAQGGPPCSSESSEETDSCRRSTSLAGSSPLYDTAGGAKTTLSIAAVMEHLDETSLGRSPPKGGKYHAAPNTGDRRSLGYPSRSQEGQGSAPAVPDDTRKVKELVLWRLFPVQPLLLKCLARERQDKSSSLWHVERLVAVLALYGLHTLKEGEIRGALDMLLRRAKVAHRKAAAGKQQQEACVLHVALPASAAFGNSTVGGGVGSVAGDTVGTSEKDMYTLSLVNLSLFLSAIAVEYPQLFEVTFVSHIYPMLFYALQHATPAYCPAASAVLALLVHNFPVSSRDRLQPIVERLTGIATSMPFSTHTLGATAKICGVYREMRLHCCLALLQRIAEVLNDNGPVIVRGARDTAVSDMERESVCTDFPLKSASNTRRKIVCFRVLHTVCMEWEGTALFFLEVCAPYLHHQNTVLRRACVQSCVRLLLSDCFLSRAERVGGSPLSDALDGEVEQVAACAVKCLWDGDLEIGSLCAPCNPTLNRSERNGIITSETRAYPFLAHAFDNVNLCDVGNVRRGFGDDGDTNSEDENNLNLDRVLECSPLEPSNHDATFTCERHTGRSHNNILREVLHRLVVVALCDPDETIRHSALNSLTKETDQFLYTHKEIVDLIFSALNDEYPPNRLQAVRILRRLGHYIPMVVYPRLRKVFSLVIQDFHSTMTSSVKKSKVAQKGDEWAGARGNCELSYGSSQSHRVNADTPTNAFTSNSTSNVVKYSADEMMLLFELVQSVPNFIPIYIDTMLQLLQQVLVPHDMLERGTVITVLHIVSFLMDETTRVEWPKFEVLLRPLSQQLLLRDNDTNRLHVAIGTLQKLIQYVVIGNPFDQRDDLKLTVESLYSLLYRRPPIDTELSLSVVKLLGTISAICTDRKFDDPQSTPLLTLATLSGSRGNFGTFASTYQLSIRPTPGYAMFLRAARPEAPFYGNEAKSGRSSQLTDYLWPDVMLRVLLRTLSDALDDIIAFTDEELQACLQAAVVVLRSSDAPSKLQLYLPPLLSVLAGLLERTDEDAPLRVYVTESIVELVKPAGRTIAPMFELLVVFLSEHLMSSIYTLPSCCKLLIGLCEASPDLVQEHCEWFVLLLLGKLMHHVEMATSATASATMQRQRRNQKQGVPQQIPNDFDPSPQDTIARSYVPGSVIGVVLQAVLALLPIADGSTVHYACLMFSQILRRAGGISEPLMVGEETVEGHTSNVTIPTGLSVEVIRGIVQALVDLLENFDLTAISMFVVETALLLLRIYAKAAHGVTNQPSTRCSEEESTRRNILLVPAGDTPKIQETPKITLGSLPYGHQEPPKTWFNQSPLSRLVVEEIVNKNTSITYRFPFDEVTTSWEAQVEMDLLACVFLVCGRCRLPAVSYELVVGEYIEERFQPSERIKEFFRAVSSPTSRVSLLHGSQQKPPLNSPLRSDGFAAETELRGETIGMTPSCEKTATPTKFERAWSSMHQLVKHTCFDGDIPRKSAPIPMGSTNFPSSMRSSLLSSPYPTQNVSSVRDITVFAGRESGPGVGCTTHVTPASNISPVAFVSGDRLLARVASSLSENEELRSVGRKRLSQVCESPFSVGGGVVNLSGRAPSSEVQALADNVSLDIGRDYDNENMDGDIEEQRFFKLHENLSNNEWRPWFELFCVILVECSDHACVSSCTSLLRRHFSIFSSDILPVAFLSHLVACDCKRMVRWLELLRDFAYAHDYIPHTIAGALAQLAYNVRLTREALLSPSLAKTVAEEFVTLDLVAALAEKALDAPLVLVCAEEKLLSEFSWEAAARLYRALEDLNYPFRTNILCNQPGFRNAIRKLMRNCNGEKQEEHCWDTPVCAADGVPGESDHNSPFPWEVADDATSVFGLFPMLCGVCPVATDPSSWRREENTKVKKRMPPPVVLEFAWPEVALGQYLRLICDGLDDVHSEEAVGGHSCPTSLGRELPVKISSNDVVGAMRCYMRVYDFESILNLWKVVRGIRLLRRADERAVNKRFHEIERSLLRTMWPTSECPTEAHIANFVVSAAKSLSRWDVVKELSYSDFLPDGEGNSQFTQPYRSFPFYKQMEISRAAALVKSKCYGEAKGVLAPLRAALRDSYTVFYTENARLKIELSVMFQEISDLEEGINAIELKRTTGGASSDFPAGSGPLPGIGTSHSVGNSVCASPELCGEGRADYSPSYTGTHAGHEQHYSQGKRCMAYTEATMRRLQNIAGRLLPEHSTILQRFEIIALRSTLGPPEWQLQNILILCERIAEEGKPRRAVQAIEHFLTPPIDDADREGYREYRSSLMLEKYRIGLQHLCDPQDLESLSHQIALEMSIDIDMFTGSQPTPVQLAAEDPSSCLRCAYTGAIGQERSESMLLLLLCQRKMVRAKRRQRHCFSSGSAIGASNGFAAEPVESVNVISSQSEDNGSSKLRSPLCSNGATGRVECTIDCPRSDAEIVREYYRIEEIVSTHEATASVWRELGLLLFDVCMAIYKEWVCTRESKTLSNFCIRSKEAISALQKAVTIWNTQTFSSISGVGPYQSTSVRRLRHSRTALPVVHLLLKSLHLAMMLSDILSDEAHVKCLNNVGSTSPTAAEASKKCDDDYIGGDFHQAPRSSCADSVNEVLEDSKPWSEGMGFSNLDFSPGMHLHWGCALPFLINAAARYDELRSVVRDMCSHSRVMLYQCVYQLVSLDHNYSDGCKTERELSHEHSNPCGLRSPSCISTAAPSVPCSQVPAEEQLLAEDTVKRTATQEPQEERSQRFGHFTDILSNLGTVSEEHRTVIDQTLQFCEFVMGGKGTTLVLGGCALPVPLWNLQRYMAMMCLTGETTGKFCEAVKAGSTGAARAALVSGVCSTSVELQRIQQVRRQMCCPSAEGTQEEVFVLLLSDGTMPRFHRFILTGGSSTDCGGKTSGGAVPITQPFHASPCDLRRNAKGLNCPSALFSDVNSFFSQPCESSTPVPVANHFVRFTADQRQFPGVQEPSNYVPPIAAMECVISCLLGHLPVRYLRRPLVLPLGLKDFITQLPNVAVTSSNWQMKLPPSLQAKCTAFMGRQPLSLFHILNEYKKHLFSNSALDGRRDDHHGCQSRVFGGGSDGSPRCSPVAKAEMRAASPPHHRRHRSKKRGLSTQYEQRLANAFDYGSIQPLCSFIEKNLEVASSATQLPRPAAQMGALYSELVKLLPRCSCNRRGTKPESGPSPTESGTQVSKGSEGDPVAAGETFSVSSTQCKCPNTNWTQLDESLLTEVRLIILRHEAPLYTDALQLSLYTASTDAGKWLNIVQTFTGELAECSMIEYLLDVTDRESTTFFVDTATGHVATHCLGGHALQRRRQSRHSVAFQHSQSLNGGEPATTETGRKADEEDVDVTPGSSPFPCTDPTIFRLTGSLLAVLPLKCPFGVFLSTATQCLFSMLRYQTDLVGIVKYGLEDLRGFACRHVPLQQEQFPESTRGFNAESGRRPTSEHGRGSTDVDSIPGSLGLSPYAGLSPKGSNNQVPTCVSHRPGEVRVNTFSIADASGASLHSAFTGGTLRDGSPRNTPESTNSQPPLHSTQDVITAHEKTVRCEVHEPFPHAMESWVVANKGQGVTVDGAPLRRKSSSAAVSGLISGISVKKAAQQRSLNLDLPKLFDCASIFVKLSDDLLPMRREPAVEAFSGLQSKSFKDSVDTLRCERAREDLKATGPLQHATSDTEVEEKRMLQPDKSCNAHPHNANVAITAQTVESRVVQLINAAVNNKNLIGTTDVPHRWRSWAPQW
ncbi:hypothetical protein, conserved [Trypanosoma brucei gambiense DAL972]|uniref:PI3K/PI4K catalytic domain-containing protein n=1 Tax=Trypanosoma brucei gambiense (strain MHOM/CI/86/DAL972) TaxID=679716 RepID=C9ZP64_TRYB9|nr:hypothetical protein, conserved [Trypanosoma brucei gambiense DAL972]CBH11192.1 hypothetical protein, conserved [Trypanosoma brucei gambiense DAL972]|eukprot:XP_011773479.1 hypothetical protein, conserved [Trypanosoma brucei gambiense DAL972]